MSRSGSPSSPAMTHHGSLYSSTIASPLIAPSSQTSRTNSTSNSPKMTALPRSRSLEADKAAMTALMGAWTVDFTPFGQQKEVETTSLHDLSVKEAPPADVSADLDGPSDFTANLGNYMVSARSAPSPAPIAASVPMPVCAEAQTFQFDDEFTEPLAVCMSPPVQMRAASPASPRALASPSAPASPSPPHSGWALRAPSHVVKVQPFDVNAEFTEPLSMSDSPPVRMRAVSSPEIGRLFLNQRVPHHLEAQTVAMECQLEDMKAALILKESENLKLKNTIEDLHDAHAIAITGLELENEVLKSALTYQERQSEGLKAALSDQENESELLKVALTHQGNESLGLKTSLTHQENMGKVLRASLNHHKNENEGLKASLIQHQNEVEGLKASLVQQKSESDGLKASLDHQRGEREGLKASLDHQRSESDRLKASLIHQRSKSEGLKASLIHQTNESERLKASLIHQKAAERTSVVNRNNIAVTVGITVTCS